MDVTDTAEMAALTALNALLEDFIGVRFWSAETNLKLERIEHLLELSARPERAYPHVHVGGTSGKGTVAASTAAILSAHGLSVGLHLSPYVQSLNETWQIDGRNASPSTVLRVAAGLRELTSADPAPYGPPSYFEMKVAIAFSLFRALGVDLGVIEVGLGGTLDATNVLGPGVKVLTNVGLDHTEILGDTIEKIAADKIGIFKSGSRVVCGATQPTVRELIRNRCRELQVSLWLIDDELTARRSTSGRLVIDMDGFASAELDLPATWPRYREVGAALAVAAAALSLDGVVEPVKASEALRSVRLPGRAEFVRRGRRAAVLDGAHNEDKLAAALTGIRRAIGSRRAIGVVALKSSKDAATLIKILYQYLDAVVFTTFHAPPWICIPPDDLAEIAGQVSDRRALVAAEPADAIEQAESLAGESGLVIVTGSFYLVGNVRHLWVPDVEWTIRGGSYDLHPLDGIEE